MRELRFRAWDKNKKMWTNWKCYDNMFYFMDKNTGVWIRDDEFERFVLMQDTGLKDINGVEIYERDIVELVWDGEETTLEVVFDLEELAYLGRDVRYVVPKYKYLSVNDEIKVIGNTYENPELLEAVRK